MGTIFSWQIEAAGAEHIFTISESVLDRAAQGNFEFIVGIALFWSGEIGSKVLKIGLTPALRPRVCVDFAEIPVATLLPSSS